MAGEAFWGFPFTFVPLSDGDFLCPTLFTAGSGSGVLVAPVRRLDFFRGLRRKGCLESLLEGQRRFDEQSTLDPFRTRPTYQPVPQHVIEHGPKITVFRDFLSSATNTAVGSLSFWHRELNLKRFTLGDGLGLKWVPASSTSSENENPSSFFGEARVLSSL